MMVITNQEVDGFSDELGRILLNDIAVQDRFIKKTYLLQRNMGSKMETWYSISAKLIVACR